MKHAAAPGSGRLRGNGHRSITAAIGPASQLVQALPLVGNSNVSPLAAERSGDIRRSSVHEAHTAFDLIDELEHLTRRSVECNVLFAPRFLVPAMPRLDERAIRLLRGRDEAQGRSRLRFLMPFSVETTSIWGRRRVVRAWTHPFGRLGTLPLDKDDPAGTAGSLLASLSDPAHGLPDLLVLPDLPLEGDMATLVKAAAAARGLPVAVADRTDRALLEATGNPLTFLRHALGAHGLRDHRRRMRRLAEAGEVGFEVAVEPSRTRAALEEFLLLEVSGWKGRQRTALVDDRHRAAFAREAIEGLSAQGRVRIYTLRLGTSAVASLIVLVCEGQAVAWKTAFDERYRKFGPGALVVALASQAMVADPAIERVDSCAVPDQRMINRLWRQRISIGTLIVGLSGADPSSVAKVADDLERRRRRLQRRRQWRLRLRRLFGRL